MSNDWDDRYRKQFKKYQRRYNHYYNPYSSRGPGGAWWYPYWNQFIAPVLNPIVSMFQPIPYGTYPGAAPAIIYP